MSGGTGESRVQRRAENRRIIRIAGIYQWRIHSWFHPRGRLCRGRCNSKSHDDCQHSQEAGTRSGISGSPRRSIYAAKKFRCISGATGTERRNTGKKSPQRSRWFTAAEKRRSHCTTQSGYLDFQHPADRRRNSFRTH